MDQAESASRADLAARSSGSILFRPMTLSDVPQVHAIDQASFSMPWPERSYHYELTQNANSILWVAEVIPEHSDVPRRIIGMIVVWLVVDEAHVATLAVHPDFRGQGLSNRLLALGLRSAIVRGAVDSTLEVRASNLKAIKLYEKFGYLEVGQRPRYYRDNNEDAILMTVKGLGPAYLNWLGEILAGV